jgi:hypothetical protein
MSFHSQSFTTPGSTNFTVPTYDVLVVVVKGPGQGGAGADDDGGGNPVPGSAGSNHSSDTTFNTSVIGTKAGGSAPSGGTYNNIKEGGAGGAYGDGLGLFGNPGNAAVKIYFPGDLTPGASIPVSIPSGGAGASGGLGNGATGANGSVDCYWTDAGSNVTFLASDTFRIPAYTSMTVFIFGAGGGGEGQDSGTGLIHPVAIRTSQAWAQAAAAGWWLVALVAHRSRHTRLATLRLEPMP